MRTSKKLHDRLTRMVARINPSIRKRKGQTDIPEMGKLIDDGFDPLHAVYVFVVNVTSYFSDSVSQFPEMRQFLKLITDFEVEYMPSGPPMSPLTTSFFVTWAFYDLRFDDSDTLASCMIDASDVIKMDAIQLEALKNLASSRMGIYEHVGIDGRYVRLRELLTNAEFTCYCTSGYRGTMGELWYVRILPPLCNSDGYFITFTTPYILMASKEDWIQYLRRGTSRSRRGAGKDALHAFLKYGPNPRHWSEFVFAGYHHHQFDAIFLTGIPDLKETLPHA
jgi:hypothetical protein